MKKYLILFIVVLALLPQSGKAASQSYATPGTYAFTVPAGVTTISAKIVGGGGGGGGAVMDGDYWSGFGGGSGGYILQDVNVSPGQTIAVTVGAGGCGGRYWYFGTDRWAETGVAFTSAPYLGCPGGQYSGGNGGNSSVSSFVATGGHGGLVGGGAWYYYGLDSNDGAGGTPNGVAGGAGGNASTGGCTYGVGGNSGQGGSGGDGMSCTNGYAQHGENGSVTITWGQNNQCQTGTPLYLGQVQFCNAGVVTTNPNHLNCATAPIGYASPVAGGTQLYVGTAPNCNDGVVSTNPNHLNCATRSIGYSTSVAGGTTLFEGTVANCNSGVVTTNNVDPHLNCAVRPIGYTMTCSAPTVNLFFSQ